ncbi:hypothetical protein RI367_001372 [Sorochytrium milnesiophthora]
MADQHHRFAAQEGDTLLDDLQAQSDSQQALVSLILHRTPRSPPTHEPVLPTHAHAHLPTKTSFTSSFERSLSYKSEAVLLPSVSAVEEEQEEDLDEDEEDDGAQDEEVDDYYSTSLDEDDADFPPAATVIEQRKERPLTTILVSPPASSSSAAPEPEWHGRSATLVSSPAVPSEPEEAAAENGKIPENITFGDDVAPRVRTLHRERMPTSDTLRSVDSHLSMHRTSTMRSMAFSVRSRTLVAVEQQMLGTSTFIQSLFNAVNVLIGIGVLALPFAFRLTGMVFGIVLSVLCALITNRTAKMLGKLMSLSIEQIDMLNTPVEQLDPRKKHHEHEHNDDDDDDDDENTPLVSGGKGTHHRRRRPIYKTMANPRRERTTTASPQGLDRSQVAVGPLPHLGVTVRQVRNRRVRPPLPFGRTITSTSIAHSVLPPAATTQLRTYSDIGHLAFGVHGRIFISIVFMLELFAAAVALIVLISDSIVALFPQISIVHVKIAAGLFVTPLTFAKSLRFASYGSLVGVFAIMFMVSVTLFMGLTRHEAPGSLWEIHPTVEMLPSDWSVLPLAFGLLMAGYAGHAVFPSLRNDMANPRQYSRLVNISYSITFSVYMVLAICGYLMFGRITRHEITQNLSDLISLTQNNGVADQLPSTLEVLQAQLIRLTLWLIVVNPITKYPLNMQPLTINAELYLAQKLQQVSGFRFELLRIMTKSAVSAAVVVVAIIWPGFDKVMALMGSFFSYIVSGIFPIACYWRIMNMAAERNRVTDEIEAENRAARRQQRAMSPTSPTFPINASTATAGHRRFSSSFTSLPLPPPPAPTAALPDSLPGSSSHHLDAAAFRAHAERYPRAIYPHKLPDLSTLDRLATAPMLILCVILGTLGTIWAFLPLEMDSATP